MQKRFFYSALAASALIFTQAMADMKVGIVSFRRCVEESKQGKSEQSAFEALKTQMGSVLEKTDKELEEVSKKLQDTEYLDGLSPEAETELRTKFDSLNQEMARYQNQYYQILNQANMKVMQNMSLQVAGAAKALAQKEGFDLIVSEDACFYFKNSLETTPEIIDEMDRIFASQSQAQAASKDTAQ